MAFSGGLVRFAAWCGVLIVAICGTVIVQFFLGRPVGIDELFWKHQFVSPLTHPGRMAPNAAAALFLVGISLLLRAKGWIRNWLMSVMGGIIVAFAVLPLLAFFSQQFFPDHSEYRDMALPTVGCLILLAMAILRRAGPVSERESPALPFLAAALGMLISIGVVLVQKDAELVEANRRVTHTYEVRSVIDNFISEVARMESSARAYVLTGEESFHIRDGHHRAEAIRQLEILKRLVADNREQLARVDSLTELARQKFVQSEKMLQVRQDEGREAAAKFLTAQPTTISSALVNLADIVKLEENRLLVERSNQRAEVERDAHTIEWLGSLIALGLMIAAVVIARRS